MRRVVEPQDIRSLERELRKQHFRYHLAIKDGALDSIVAEVVSKIAELEDKIARMRSAERTPEPIFDGEMSLAEEQEFSSNGLLSPA